MDDRAIRPMLPQAGDMVDRYRIVAEIARGGMAVIYAVQRSSIGGFEKLLAMKVMLPHLAEEAHFVNMFLDEAMVASRIQHPNVVQVFDLGRHAGGAPFLLMELVDGQSLSAVVARSRESAAPRTAFWLEVLAQVAEGLHAAHETRGADGGLLGVIHRDVSPQNVLVGYDGRVKVVDFGIAAARGRLAGTRTGELKGKFAYLAPEQVSRDSTLTRRVDLWALGVVAWELVAGRRLFAAADEATALWNVMSGEVPDVRGVAAGLPESAASVIMACLARDPERRPATAKEVARVFGAAAVELSAGRAPDLATAMQALFGRQRETGREQVAVPIGRGSKPTSRSGPTGDAPPAEHSLLAREPVPVATAPNERTELSSVGPREPVRGAGVRRLSAIALGIGVLGVGAGLAAQHAMSTARSGGEAETATAKAAAVPVEDAPSVVPATQSIVRVRVDPSVRLALVDGRRHDERPLEVSVPEGATAVVELVGVDGRIVEHAIGEADDGKLLALPAPSSSETPAPSTSVKRTPSKLLRNPF